jgi:hypothetical protein
VSRQRFKLRDFPTYVHAREEEKKKLIEISLNDGYECEIKLNCIALSSAVAQHATAHVESRD